MKSLRRRLRTLRPSRSHLPEVFELSRVKYSCHNQFSNMVSTPPSKYLSTSENRRSQKHYKACSAPNFLLSFRRELKIPAEYVNTETEQSGGDECQLSDSAYMWTAIVDKARKRSLSRFAWNAGERDNIGRPYRPRVVDKVPRCHSVGFLRSITRV